MSAPWRLAPHFLVRGTGFPVNLVLRLACVDAVAAIDDVLDCEEDLATLTARVEPLLATEGSPDRRRWWRQVHNGRPVGAHRLDSAAAATRTVLGEWDAAVARRDGLVDSARETFASELPKRRADLHDIVADPRFGEAVWLSSPQMYDHGVRGYLEGRGGPSATRRVERQLVAYLQRFCAKNDTAAFFGPIDYGGVGDACPPRPPDRRGAGHVRRREAFVAAWGATALARAIAADPAVRPHLRPALTGLVRAGAHTDVAVTGGATGLAGHARRVPDPGALEILEAVDGDRTVAAIATRCGRTPADGLAVLDRLAAIRVVRLEPTAPVTDAHPVSWLHDWVSALPADCSTRERWLTEMGGFMAAESSFADAEVAAKRRLLADLEESFTRLTGEPARRGGGAFYADRLLVYEEAAGDAGPLRLEPAGGERLRAALAPVLEFFAGYACAVQDALRATGVAHLTTGARPLLSWVAELRAAPADASLTSDPVRAWHEPLLAQLRDRAHEREVELDLTPPAATAALDAEVLISSPDVMLLADDETAARQARGDVVIGECHDAALVWGWPLRFHPDAAAVERDIAALLGEATGDRVLANVLPSRRIKIIPFEYPGPTVEIAAASTKAAPLRIPAAAVTVELRDGRPTLAAPGVGDFTLYNGELHTLAHRIVAQPRVVPPAGLDTGAHTPRLRVGPVIIQRERWRVVPGELFPRSYPGDSFELLLDFRRAARRLGLPRFVFARLPGETKPVYVDGHSWFLVAMLHHMARGHDEIVFTEMLPGPDQLWLSGRDGRYCVELRMTMFRCPSGGAP